MTTSASSSTAGSAARSLVKLGTRVVVGINVHDTLLHFPNAGMVHRYRCRPYLRYFSNVLEAFKCDVTVFTKANRREADTLFQKFRHEFRCPFRLQHDNGLGLQYGGILTDRCATVKTRSDRMILIDVKASHHVVPGQLLLVEPFSPVKRLRGSEKAKLGAKAEDKSIALTADDYTLVALAEMIKEIASSDVAVKDYLKMEPMLEVVRVPMMGDLTLLPIESCDYIDQIDLNKLEISDPVEVEDVPDVKETEAHKDLFK